MARPRASDHDEKRRAILHRAALIFARDGYDRASMSRLAAECGVSKALLYHYHASKEALLFDILSNHLSMLVEVVEAADEPSLAPEARLERLVAALLDAYRDADAEHRVQLSALRFLPEAEQERLKALERRLVEMFAEALRSFDPARFEAPPLIKPVTMSVFGMVNWAYMWFRDGGAVSREDYARLIARLVAGGIPRI